MTTRQEELDDFAHTIKNLETGDPISSPSLQRALELVNDVLELVKSMGPDFNLVVYRLRHIQIALSTMKQSRQQMGRWKL